MQSSSSLLASCPRADWWWQGWVVAAALRRLARASPVAALWYMAVDIGGIALEESGRFVRHFLQTFMVLAPA